jgi:hypothetical protein
MITWLKRCIDRIDRGCFISYLVLVKNSGLKNLFFFFLLNTLPITGLSQYGKDTAIVKNDSVICYIPASICVDGLSSFIGWGAVPSEFRFALCDRWGERIFETEQHDFVFEDFLAWNGAKVNEGTCYYVLEFTTSDGTRYDFQGTVYYYAWYCNCG